jgi:periplasmic protein TonB
MFEKLIVSAKDRRKGKTGKIFFLTSLCYSLAIASALVMSVVAASPLLEDTSEMARAIPIIPPAFVPPTTPGPRASGGQRTSPPVRPSLLNPTRFEDIRPASTNPPVSPFANFPPTINDVPPGPGGGGNGGPGVPGGEGPGSGGIIGGDSFIEAPPAPVTKPQPQPQPPPQVQQQPMRLSSTVLTGKAIERKSPTYPAIAKQTRLQGSVTVEVMISPEGRVESARALGGHPLFVSAAVEAARGWRFQPTILNGVPVRVTGVITFNFTLE